MRHNRSSSRRPQPSWLVQCTDMDCLCTMPPTAAPVAGRPQLHALLLARDKLSMLQENQYQQKAHFSAGSPGAWLPSHG
jgi:hypothetical protein